MKKVFVIIFLSFLVVAAGIIFYFNFKINNNEQLLSGKKEIKIFDGESIWQVSRKFQSSGLFSIDDRFVFWLYEKINHKIIKSGDYMIAENLSIKEIAEILNKKEHQVIKITIIEGWRKEQIAKYLAENAKIDPEEFLTLAKDYEGKLFPDTYFLTDEPTAEEVFGKMIDNYNSRIAGLNVDDEILSIASIVEREAANDTDRATIAGVFYNRLKIGMKFESDVTVQYQKDTNNFSEDEILSYKFWQEIKAGDSKKVLGKYNTYLNNGAPPAPICNPGIASIKATLTPENHNYYYFLYGKDGVLHLATDSAGHNKNIELHL